MEEGILRLQLIWRRVHRSASYRSPHSMKLEPIMTETSVLTNGGLNDAPKGQQDAVCERLSRNLYGTGDSHQDDEYTDGKYGCDTQFLLRCKTNRV